MFEEFACVNVAEPLTLAETYNVFNAVRPFAVVGIKTIVEFSPIRALVNVDVVVLAVKVMLPVEFIFPSIVLFNDEAINRKCRSWSGIEIGTLGYWFVAIIVYLLALLLFLLLTLL